jgi:hypothetical protein
MKAEISFLIMKFEMVTTLNIDYEAQLTSLSLLITPNNSQVIAAGFNENATTIFNINTNE